MVIFNSFLYVYQRVYPINIPLNPIKPPFSYGFPMVFLWFSLNAVSPKEPWPFCQVSRLEAQILEARKKLGGRSAWWRFMGTQGYPIQIQTPWTLGSTWFELFDSFFKNRLTTSWIQNWPFSRLFLEFRRHFLTHVHIAALRVADRIYPGKVAACWPCLNTGG